MSHDVFISHSTQDKPIAEAVCATLEAHRIHCWIAPRDIPPGAEGDEAALDALMDCKSVVLVFSSHANESLRIQREVQKAFEKGTPLVVFRVDAAPARGLHDVLKNASWLDAFHPSFQSYLAELENRVRTLVSHSQTPALGSGGDARDVLCQIIAAYGPSVASDLRRLEALLRDLCGDRKQETRLLISAGQEGVPADLLSPAAQAQPADLLLSRLSRLTRHLELHLLVPQHVARWAVESWAFALGCITSRDLTTQALNVNPGPPPAVSIVPPVATEPEAKEAPPLSKTPAPDPLPPPKAKVTTQPRLRGPLLWIAALLVLAAIGIPSYLHDKHLRFIRSLAYQALNQRLLAAASKSPPDSAAISEALQEGADVNVKGIYGETPLTMASRFGSAAVVQLLINNGADVNAKDKWGDSALVQAVSGNNTAAVQVLTDKGADVNAKDNEGKTALYYAIAAKHADCVAILRAAAAKSR